MNGIEKFYAILAVVFFVALLLGSWMDSLDKKRDQEHEYRTTITNGVPKVEIVEEGGSHGSV